MLNRAEHGIGEGPGGPGEDEVGIEREGGEDVANTGVPDRGLERGYEGGDEGVTDVESQDYPYYVEVGFWFGVVPDYSCWRLHDFFLRRSLGRCGMLSGRRG